MIEVMVDVFHDKKLITPFIRDREDETVFMHHDLTEIVREAQARKIKDVNVRSLIRVVMTPEEVEEFNRKGRIEFDIEYDVTLLNYTTLDAKKVVLDDPDHWLSITDYLRLQVSDISVSKSCC